MQQAFYGGQSPWQYEALFVSRAKSVVNAKGLALSRELAELVYDVDYYVHVDSPQDAVRLVTHMPYSGHVLTTDALNAYAGPVVEQSVNQLVQVTPLEQVNERIHEITELVRGHLQDFLAVYGIMLNDVKVLIRPRDERMRELISLRAFGLSELDAVRYYVAMKMAERGLVSAPNMAVGAPFNIGYTGLPASAQLPGAPNGTTAPAAAAWHPDSPGGVTRAARWPTAIWARDQLRSLLGSDVYTAKSSVLRADDLLIRERVAVRALGGAFPRGCMAACRQPSGGPSGCRPPPGRAPFPPRNFADGAKLRQAATRRPVHRRRGDRDPRPAAARQRGHQVWDRVRGASACEELLQFDWTMVGESDALADAHRECREGTPRPRTRPLGIPASGLRRASTESVIADRRRYVQVILA